MLTNTARQSVPSPEENVLTVQEALEPLFLALEEEAEVRMIAAALKAGWTAEEAVTAIDELRMNEQPLALGPAEIIGRLASTAPLHCFRLTSECSEDR